MGTQTFCMSRKMLQLFGNDALSSFDQQKILAKLQEIDPHIEMVQAEYIHFIEHRDTLNDDELNKQQEQSVSKRLGN